jgi:hypothetical protein
MDEKQTEQQTMLKRFCIVVVFGIALGYFEAAVVVYLRAIFYPAGFTFPLSEFGGTALWDRLLLTEIGREAASLVLIFTAAALFGQDRRQRFAFFMTIFETAFELAWFDYGLGRALSNTNGLGGAGTGADDCLGCAFDVFCGNTVPLLLWAIA